MELDKLRQIVTSFILGVITISSFLGYLGVGAFGNRPEALGPFLAGALITMILVVIWLGLTFLVMTKEEKKKETKVIQPKTEATAPANPGPDF